MHEPLETEIPRDRLGPGAARAALAAWIGGRLQADDIDTARLLTSELITNALLHGRGRITLRASLTDDALLVEVMDEGAGFERLVREREVTDLGGWGLKIVDSESSRWGIHEGTTHVWFELERPGPRLGPEKRPAVADR